MLTIKLIIGKFEGGHFLGLPENYRLWLLKITSHTNIGTGTPSKEKEVPWIRRGKIGIRRWIRRGKIGIRRWIRRGRRRGIRVIIIINMLLAYMPPQ